MSPKYRLYPPLPSVVERTRWYIFIRWFLLLSVAVPSIASFYISEGWSQRVQYDVIIAVLALLSNAIFYITARKLHGLRAFRRLAVILLIIDILIVTYLIYSNGGVESRSPILYIIPILMSAIIFGRRAIYALTLTAILSYNSLLFADFMDVIHTIGAVNPSLRSYFPYVLDNMVFFSSVLFVIGVATDFNTRLLIDKERQASERLEDLKIAQSIAKFGNWEWDAVNDNVIWSEELYKIFDVPNGEEVNLASYIKIVHPDDRQMVADYLKKASKKRVSFSFDHRITTRGGAVRHIHSNGKPTLSSEGKLIKMIGTAHDVTETKRLDEAKSEFVSLASHQLRTPATGVKQYVAMLLDGYAGRLTPSQRSYLQTAYESNERQLSIINDLLQVAQIDTEKMKLHCSEVNLVTLLHSVIDEQKPNFKTKNQHIVFTSRYKKLLCTIDEARLRMALENILDNARKYTPRDKKITMRLQKQNNTILIHIIDEGVGIAKEDIHKIFEKFSRLDHPTTLQQEGSGLGLYWAKRVVEFHGGTITIHSKPGKGTSFTISIPAVKIRNKKNKNNE